LSSSGPHAAMARSGRWPWPAAATRARGSRGGSGWPAPGCCAAARARSSTRGDSDGPRAGRATPAAAGATQGVAGGPRGLGTGTEVVEGGAGGVGVGEGKLRPQAAEGRAADRGAAPVLIAGQPRRIRGEVRLSGLVGSRSRTERPPWHRGYLGRGVPPLADL